MEATKEMIQWALEDKTALVESLARDLAERPTIPCVVDIKAKLIRAALNEIEVLIAEYKKFDKGM